MSNERKIDVTIDFFKVAWNKYRTYSVGDLIALVGVVNQTIVEWRQDVTKHTAVQRLTIVSHAVTRIIELHMDPMAPAEIPSVNAVEIEAQIHQAQA